jgi:ATP-binding cassette subfamily F protein 3
MENLIQVKDAFKAFGSKTLFESISFSINEGEHVGIIGPNGAGKTTMFKILIGEQTFDSGTIVRSRGLRLGYLSQHDEWKPEETIESYLTDDSGSDSHAMLPIWELKTLGRGLGILEADYSRPVVALSGGYRMRVKLLRLLGQQPNLMLLDEPTNYLDLETLMVLEKFLQGYRGAFLLISHDREFLRRTTDHTLEIESGDATKYPGGIDDYFEQKELLRSQLQARAVSLAEKRREILDFVARFGAKASKASQAQSRLKQLEKMESIEIKPLTVGAHIRIPPPSRTGKIVLKVKDTDLGYGEKVVLRGVDLQLAAGDHLAVVGLNGAGKSTFLKALAGKLAPLRGSIEAGYQSTFAYFAQHVAQELEPNETVLGALQKKAHLEVKPQEILSLAGSLLFSGDDVYKPIRVLSGGERSRVALGQVLLQKASCLVLDEPTNHLDFETVEALTQALQKFEGSLIVVSHDRSFIRRVGTKILEISSGLARTYPGTYDEYVWSLEKGAYATLKGDGKGDVRGDGRGDSKTAALGTESSGSGGFNYKDRKKELDRRLRQLETQIADLDKKMSAHQLKIAAINEELVADAASVTSKKIQEMGALQEQVNEWEAQWFSAAEEREKVASDIRALVGKTE